MTERQFTIIVTPEPDGSAFNVAVPALPGCFTCGETIEEAIAMAKDAIGLYLEDLVACGEPIPEEMEHSQAIIISVAT
jgi:antitoxin HicB